MKPFDLQSALAGAKVVTRDGREVKIAGYNPDATDNSKIIGWVGVKPKYWHDDGRYDIFEGSCDLFMAPTEKKEWIVRFEMYGNDVALVYKSFEAAEYAAKINSGLIHEITVIE